MVMKNSIFTPVLIVGCVIILVSFAIRSSFGVFQIPIAEEFNWLRSEFSMAIALQNLAWGIGQPIFSAIAEKIGDRRAIILGAFTYASGLLLSSKAVKTLAMAFCSGSGGRKNGNSLIVLSETFLIVVPPASLSIYF